MGTYQTRVILGAKGSNHLTAHRRALWLLHGISRTTVGFNVNGRVTYLRLLGILGSGIDSVDQEVFDRRSDFPCSRDASLTASLPSDVDRKRTLPV